MSGFIGWQKDATRFFGVEDPRCEVLHDPWPADAPYNLVETSYFGFSIPQHAIRCEIYHIARPKFGLTSGGIMIYRGNKFSPLHGDYVNYFNYMPLQRSITDCTYDNGITVKMIEPGRFTIRYDDPDAGVSLRLETHATMPYAFRPKGGHFTQGMKNSGSLTFGGAEYRIDGYSSRDRSWGDPRPEGRKNIPQVGWHCAVFDENLAFHLIAFNSPDRDSVLAQTYPWLKDGGHHIWGYVWRDGELLGLSASSHKLHTDRDNIAPYRIEIDMTDERGHSYHLDGVIVARYPAQIWPNCTIYFCMAKWSYEGRSTFGETQTGVYQEFMNGSRKEIPEG